MGCCTLARLTNKDAAVSLEFCLSERNKEVKNHQWKTQKNKEKIQGALVQWFSE